MLVNLDNILDIKDKFIESRNTYDNYHVGLYIAHKFTRCWTALNVGVHYTSAIDVYQSVFKNVICFEPDQIYTKLLKHIQDNNFDNVTIHNIPLSDSARERTFYSLSKEDRSRTVIDPNNYIGGSSLNFNWSETKGDGNVKFTGKKVNTQTLDHIIKLTRVKNIDLIKIDAEMEDSRIVFGAEKTINRWRPIIQIEYCDKKCEKTLHSWDYEEAEFNIDLWSVERHPDRWFIPKERV